MGKHVHGQAIVALDLDGVVANYVEAIKPYVAEFTGVLPEDLPVPRTYNLVNAEWGLRTQEEFLAVHRRAVENRLYATMPTIGGAAKAVQRLSDAGAHIRVVTHRLITGGTHLRVVQDTASWLDANGFPYMSLCFTGLKDSVGAHVWVEDSPSTLEQLREQGYATVVFDQPYNQHVPGLRITDWESGVDVIIEELKKQGQL